MDNETLPRQLSGPVRLPIVVNIPSALGYGHFQPVSASEPILQVQMETLDGRVILLPLTEAAAKKLLVGLAALPQLQDFRLEPKLPERSENRVNEQNP
jgi:hypothetical protein